MTHWPVARPAPPHGIVSRPRFSPGRLRGPARAPILRPAFSLLIFAGECAMLDGFPK